jgi:hypothetical protein
MKSGSIMLGLCFVFSYPRAGRGSGHVSQDAFKQCLLYDNPSARDALRIARCARQCEVGQPSLAKFAFIANLAEGSVT